VSATNQEENMAKNHTAVRVGLLLAVLALTGGFLLHAANAAAADGNRFEATFLESTTSVTNRIADLGTFQLINTGSGTVEGYGAASMVISVTQDRSVQPCGPGSWTNAGIRRIVLPDGVLVIRSVAYVCQSASGPVATETWTVDGPSSTGVFAGATGSGEGTVELALARSTLSGKLKLAGP
jgi:hypothetical protein